MKGSLVIPLFAFALTGGCALNSQPEPMIPHRGDIVAQGAGQLSYRAQASGLVSVYDERANSVISSAAVYEGSIVSVNPSAGDVTVTDANRAGTQVIHSGVIKSHHHELWFIPQVGSTTRWSNQ